MKAIIKNQNEVKGVAMNANGVDAFVISNFVHKYLVPIIFNKLDKTLSLIERGKIKNCNEIRTFNVTIDYVDEKGTTCKILKHLANAYEDGYEPIINILS